MKGMDNEKKGKGGGGKRVKEDSKIKMVDKELEIDYVDQT